MNYYRKPIEKTINDVKLKMQIGALTVKITENINKINDLLEVDKDIKKDVSDNSNSINNMKNEILNTINSNFYSRSYINDNYYLKNNIYDKKYIDENYILENDIDKKDNNILNTINNNFYSRSYINNNYYLKNNVYDKNYINLLANNLYNKTYLDDKFGDIYTKREVNIKTSKLDRNIVLFNSNLTKFIDETYKEDQKLQNDKISELENKDSLTDIQINKINQLENIDLNKIDASYNFSVFNKRKLDSMRYYIKEFIPFNISLVRKFTFTGNTNEIMILQFEMDQRTFDKDDIINFYLNITIQYDNSKTNWYRLKLKFDILYDDETLIKSFFKMPTSKGFLYQHLMNYVINRYIKLSKDTQKIIFKIYMSKVNTSLQDNIVFTLQNSYEDNYCDLIHYTIL